VPSTPIIDLYPNPSNGLITINHPRDLRATIFDKQGRNILTTQSKGGLLDLQNLVDGSYLLSISEGDKELYSQLIVIQQ